MKIPDTIDFPVAAAFGLTYTTGLHALKNRGNLKAGETLLVLGASAGVGLAAFNLGKLMGAFVIACASTQDKLDARRRAGADSTINYESEDLRKRIGELTGGKGVDVVCDPVGGKLRLSSRSQVGRELRHFGLCSRWGIAPRTAALGRSAVVGQEFNANGRLAL